MTVAVAIPRFNLRALARGAAVVRHVLVMAHPGRLSARMDCYTNRLDAALALAADAFRGMRRKGTTIPYLAHLLQVFVTVAENGGDEDQMIAAILHDYLEDVEGSTADELSRRFGGRVARLVEGLSDTTARPKPPWRARKESYLAHLRVAPSELKLVSAADKLHNARSIHRDLLTLGDAIWDRFTSDREGTLWYYREVASALAFGWDHALVAELDREVRAIHAAAGLPIEA